MVVRGELAKEAEAPFPRPFLVASSSLLCLLSNLEMVFKEDKMIAIESWKSPMN